MYTKRCCDYVLLNSIKEEKKYYIFISTHRGDEERQKLKMIKKSSKKNFYFQTQWNEEALELYLAVKIMFAVKMLLLLAIFINNPSFFYFAM